MLNDQRLMALLSSRERAIEEMNAEHTRRTAGHDRVVYEPDRSLVTYLRQGVVVWAAQAELIAVFMTDIQRFRWWWVMPGKEVGSDSRINACFATGQQRGIPTLTSRSPAVTSEREAGVIVTLCASLASAQGVYAERAEDRISYYALFGATAGRPTRPPPVTPVRPSGLPPPSRVPSFPASIPQSPKGGQVGSSFATVLPPPLDNAMGESTEGGSGSQGIGTEWPMESVAPVMSLRPPSLQHPVAPGSDGVQATASGRHQVRNLAQQSAAALAQQLPAFQQALTIVDLDVRDGKARFSVQLVAIDGEGNLTALDPSQAMMAATMELIRDKAQPDGRRWRRMTIRMVASLSGISIHAETKA